MPTLAAVGRGGHNPALKRCHRLRRGSMAPFYGYNLLEELWLVRVFGFAFWLDLQFKCSCSP